MEDAVAIKSAILPENSPALHLVRSSQWLEDLMQEVIHQSRICGLPQCSGLHDSELQTDGESMELAATIPLP
eukprot:30589-Eustigmatos_ZCMA.PRE.1